MTKGLYRTYKITATVLDSLGTRIDVITTATDALTAGATYDGVASVRTCRSPEGPWADDVASGGSITRMMSVGPPPLPDPRSVQPGVVVAPITPLTLGLHWWLGPLTLGTDSWEANQLLQSDPKTSLRSDILPIPVPVTVTFRRREPITVEAGHFEDSIVVDSSWIIDYPQYGFLFEFAQKEWYARGVGLVKLVYGNSGIATGPVEWEMTDHGTLSSPAPKLLSASPSAGPLAGGTEVILSGDSFAPGAKVLFAGFPAKSVTVESPTVIRAVTPVLSAGPAEVTVANADCQVSILDTGFTFK